MRRLTITAAVLASAGLLSLTLPGIANAASGELVIVPQTIHNPSGCYDAKIYPLIVFNKTDQTAIVYDGPKCKGNVIGTVPPGESGTFEFGASVYIQ